MNKEEASCDHVQDVGTTLQSFGDPLDSSWYQFSTELNLRGDSLKYEACCKPRAALQEQQAPQQRHGDGGDGGRSRDDTTGPPRVALQEQRGP